MVQKHFPKVTRVKDAKHPIRLTVKAEDSTNGDKAKPESCALARAAKRELKADGAIINLSSSYVVKGTTAIRYKTSELVAREITSFDRGGDFAAGKDYLLTVFPKSSRLGHLTGSGTHGDRTPRRTYSIVHTKKHRTIGVRRVNGR